MTMGLHEINASDHGTIFQTFVNLKDELKDALPQGSVNPGFNRQLQIFRESLLQDVLSNWEELIR